MFEHILDCPKCGKRFHYEHEGNNFPENISCPGCGASSPWGEFEVLLLCHECHVKLKVPLSMLNDEGNCCPKCGAEIHNDRLSHLSQAGTTIAGVPVTKEKKRMLNNGDIFDKYQIISFLGRGGMAEVYLAEHLLLKQKCALKLMQRSLDQDDNPVFIKRFVREAKLTHSLSHPNIVKVFDAGSDFKTGYLFLAMEYVEGKTLHEIIHEKDFSEDELLEILSVMANALKVLESAKVVHRDIKPSNIMYTREGAYKLMDLGIAKMESNHQAGDMTLTMEKSTIGTPGYASPEQCSSAHLVDIRSDIFSLGAALYHAATGFIPFTGDTPVAAILNTMQKDPDPIRNHRSDLSNEFIALIEKMLKKKPSERFQNIDELIEAIDKVERGKTLPAPVRKLKTAINAISTTIFTSNKEKVATEKKFPPLLRRFCWLLVILFLTIVTVVHIFYLVNHTNSPEVKLSYSDFMKNFFSLSGDKPYGEIPAPGQKTREPLPGDGESEDDAFFRNKFQSAHPLVLDPDKDLRPLTGSGQLTRYTMIRSVLPLEEYRFRTFDFKNANPEFRNALPAMFHDGTLILTDQEKTVFYSGPSSSMGWSLILNFMLSDNKKASIVSQNDLQLFVYKGTLRIFMADYYVDTTIHIPAWSWVNLAVSVNYNEGRIDLISCNRLLGSYLFPQSVRQKYSAIRFGSAVLQNSTLGKIDFMAVTGRPLSIVPQQPIRRALFAVSRNRYSDAITLKAGEENQKSAGPVRTPVSAPGAAGAPESPLRQVSSGVPNIMDQAAKSIDNVKPEQNSVNTGSSENTVKSNTLLPALTSWEMETCDSNMTAEAALKISKENLKRYRGALEQWKQQKLPDSVPREIIEKRKLILATASEIAERWQKRIRYMERRNQKIKEAENFRYSGMQNQRLKNEIEEYLNLRSASSYTMDNRGRIVDNHDRVYKRMTPKDRKRFEEKLLQTLSSHWINPNLEVLNGSYAYKDGKRLPGRSSLITLASASLFGNNSNAVIRLLLKRYVNLESMNYMPSRVVLPDMIEYGLPPRFLTSASNMFLTGGNNTDINIMANLFMDGVKLQSHHLARAVFAGNYDATLFFLACGVRPWGNADAGGNGRIRELLLAAGAVSTAPYTRSSSKSSSPQWNPAFSQEWMRGDITAVKAALQSRRISPNQLLENGQTLLTSACAKEDLELVKLLLDNGADPNLRDKNNLPPLLSPRSRIISIPRDVATWSQIMLLLLEKGANLGDASFETSSASSMGALSLLFTVVTRYPNNNEMLPRLAKYLKQVPESQWKRIMFRSNAFSTFIGNPSNLTRENKLLLLEHCPGTLFKSAPTAFWFQICRIEIPPALMQKMLDHGMPTDFFPGNSTPVLYSMIRTQSPAVIEKVLKAMPEKSKAKVKNWRSAQQKKGIIDYTQNEQIKNLLRRYLAPGVTR